jgi:cyclophilin family peptidyl-prolyl cis-trans isomerase
MKKILLALSLLIPFSCVAVNPDGGTVDNQNGEVVIGTPLPASTSRATVQPTPGLPAPTPTPEVFNPNKDYLVTMVTSMGTIKLKLFPLVAPKAVENFTRLIAKKYYDGLIFHRVIPDFMIQGGDPLGNGTGGQSIFGRPFEDEISPNLTFTKKGQLAMANSGPNTNGSQFFITLIATNWLNGKHTIFGEVTDGLNVLDAIAAVQRDENDKPLKNVVMTKLTVN